MMDDSDHYGFLAILLGLEKKFDKENGGWSPGDNKRPDMNHWDRFSKNEIPSSRVFSPSGDLFFGVGAILVIEFRLTLSNAACPHLQGTSTMDLTVFPEDWHSFGS